jgi:integrase
MSNKPTSVRGRSIVLRAVEALFRASVSSPGPGAATPPTGLLTLDWLTRWMAERCPKRSAHTYRVLCRGWLEEIGPVPLAELTTDDLRPLLLRLVKEGRSGSTVHAYRSWLRTVLGDAVREGLLAANPASAFRRGEFPPKTPRREKGFYDAREVECLLDGTGGRARVAAAIGCATGARLSEITGAQIQSYVRDAKPLPMFRIATAWRERLGELGPTKTDVVREVPAHPVLSAILEDWIDRGWRETYGRDPGPTDYLVPSERLSPLTGAAVRQDIYAALERLGMRRRIVHDFCRTFCMLLRAAGAPRDLVKFLRHPRPTEVHDRYLLWPYPTLCAAVSAVDLKLSASSPQLELFKR